MGRTSGEHRVAILRTLGAGLLAPPLLVPLLEQGGLAPIAIAAVSALLVGGPAAVVQWRISEVALQPAPLREAVGSAGELAACLWASAAVALALRDAGGLVWALVALVWVSAALLSLAPRLLAGAAALSVLGLVGAAGRALWVSAPWTLLEPHWDGWMRYAGPSALAGLVMAGVGLGAWTQGVRRPPGERHAPWLAVGMALLATWALAVERSGRYELALGAPVAQPPLLTLLLVGLLASGLGAWLGRGLGARAPLVRGREARGATRWTALAPVLAPALAGLMLSGLLAGPASGALPLVLGGLVPALVLAELLSCATRSQGADRVLMGLGALLVLCAAALGWPGLPGRVLDAALLGLFLVGAFWFVATRSVLAGRSA